MSLTELALDAEQRRLAALAGLAVLDTAPEPVFDAITRAAADACGVPIALVSLVDSDRQWFKSNIGLPGVGQTPREVAFCDHAIRNTVLFEVTDATQDARFATNPLVLGDPSIRFYAGAPVLAPEGEVVGTVCVIDRVPRALTAAQREMLAGLGRVASVALADRRRHLDVVRALALGEARYRAIVEDQVELISLAQPDGTLLFVNSAYARHYGRSAAELIGCNLLDLVAAHNRDGLVAVLRSVVADGVTVSGIDHDLSAAGRPRAVQWTNRPIADALGQPALVQSVGRDITELHQAGVQLKQALDEKETLLKEVYHRVKNNLQVVQSLLSLQQRGSADAGVRKVLEESARRVRAMALVHEKLYQSGNLAELSLREYTHDLLRQIGEAVGGSTRSIKFEEAVDDIPGRLEHAVPFGLLVTELVSNAMEHAFVGREVGVVRVRLERRGATPWLTVSDDGAGLPAGFDLGAVSSMGLQLAASLAQQLGGGLQAGNEGGAVFRTAMPLI